MGRVSGIYQIRNLRNGKLYVGSAVDLDYRKSRHFSDLKLKRHPNSYLQRAFDKHGRDEFVFEVIEYCEPQMLIEREQFWIDAKRRNGEIYNLSPTAGNQLGIKRSEETKRKMSEAQRARKYSPSEEMRAKMAAAKIGTHFKKGKKLSPESCDRIAASRIGKKASEETRKKLSLARMGNRNAVGNKQSEETRRKRVESMKRTFALRRIAEGQLWLPL